MRNSTSVRQGGAGWTHFEVQVDLLTLTIIADQKYVLEETLFDSLVLVLSVFPDILLTRLMENCEKLTNRLLQIILNNCHSASLYRHCCLLRKRD